MSEICASEVKGGVAFETRHHGQSASERDYVVGPVWTEEPLGSAGV